MHITDTEKLHCPYCGECIEIVIDHSVECQEYIEDCQVCCRPITLQVAVEQGVTTVNACSENDII